MDFTNISIDNLISNLKVDELIKTNSLKQHNQTLNEKYFLSWYPTQPLIVMNRDKKYA